MRIIPNGSVLRLDARAQSAYFLAAYFLADSGAADFLPGGGAAYLRKALRPVSAWPTTRVCISGVPS